MTSGSIVKCTIRCPCHDDRRPSLYIVYTPDNGRLWYKCYAGCESNDIMQQAVLDALAVKGYYIDSSAFRRGNMSVYRTSTNDVTMLDSFQSVHCEDFDRRGLTVADVVPYKIVPAKLRRGDSILDGLLIPIISCNGVIVGYQFCNLTGNRVPKYINLTGKCGPSVLSYKNAKDGFTLFIVEGYYKAIVSHILLKKLWSGSFVVGGVQNKLSYSEIGELVSVCCKGARPSRVVLAMDSDLNESELDKCIEAVRNSMLLNQLQDNLYITNFAPYIAKGFDDYLLWAIKSGVSELSLSDFAIPESSRHYISADLVECANGVTWLVDNFIPMRCVTVIEGKPGVGKSYFALALASSVTMDGSSQAVVSSALGQLSVNQVPGSKCLIINCEDSESVIAMRLRQIEAPLSQCLISRKHFRFPRDIAYLRNTIIKEGISAVVIDTLSNHIDYGLSCNDEATVRSILSDISMICNESNAVAIIVRHLRKSSGDNDGVEAGIGSIGIAGIARSVIRVVRMDTFSRALVIKSNYAPPGLAFDYDLSTLKVGKLPHSSNKISKDDSKYAIDIDEGVDADELQTI